VGAARDDDGVDASAGPVRDDKGGDADVGTARDADGGVAGVARDVICGDAGVGAARDDDGGVTGAARDVVCGDDGVGAARDDDGGVAGAARDVICGDADADSDGGFARMPLRDTRPVATCGTAFALVCCDTAGCPLSPPTGQAEDSCECATATQEKTEVAGSTAVSLEDRACREASSVSPLSVADAATNRPLLATSLVELALFGRRRSIRAGSESGTI